jgi:hypothetical protein
MGPRRTLWEEVAEIATSRGGMEQRAQALLTPLRSVVPYSAAWIAVRDPETRFHRPVAQDGATTPWPGTSRSRRPMTNSKH